MYLLSSSSFPLASWGGIAGAQKELGKLDYVMVLYIFCQTEFYHRVSCRKKSKFLFIMTYFQHNTLCVITFYFKLSLERVNHIFNLKITVFVLLYLWYYMLMR